MWFNVNLNYFWFEINLEYKFGHLSVVKNEHLFLFQNDVALYFEPYWKQEKAADINVLVLH